MLAIALLLAADNVGGWPDLFPALGNFERKVAEPVVAKGDKPAAYSQSATYEWLGGRFEVITITIARDPAFQEKYAADALKKADPAPEAVEVNKKRAYLWDRMKAEELEKVNRKLVVVLADDKILLLEQRGAGLELPEVAQKLDFAKVAKALGTPPAKK